MVHPAVLNYTTTPKGYACKERECLQVRDYSRLVFFFLIHQVLNGSTLKIARDVFSGARLVALKKDGGFLLLLDVLFAVSVLSVPVIW